MDQEITNNYLQQVEKQISLFKDTIIASTAELKAQLDETTRKVDDSAKIIKDCSTESEKITGALHKEVVILRDVSKRMQEFVREEIQLILPALTQNIDNIYQDKLKALDHNIITNSAKLDEITMKATGAMEQYTNKHSQSIDQIIYKSKQIGNSYLRQLGITIGVTTIITIIVSVLSSYFMVQRIPTRVVMNADKDINISNSEVKILKHPVRRK